jgi:TfoX/Sxy family transcriptional regulator of competence genes
MAYDEHLAERVRELLDAQTGIREKRMFGGLAFLLDGNMAVAVSGHGGLMVRVPPDATDDVLDRANAAPMVMNGRPARGWVRVDADGVRTSDMLRSWVDMGVEYARSLPAK